MAGQYPGLVKLMLANGISKVIIDTPVGPRCFIAEMSTTNPMARGRSVAQGRFACDGYCGLIAKRPSRVCRGVDTASIASLRGQPLPAGVALPAAGTPAVALPYHSGEGAGAGGGLGARPSLPFFAGTP